MNKEFTRGELIAALRNALYMAESPQHQTVEFNFAECFHEFVFKEDDNNTLESWV